MSNSTVRWRTKVSSSWKDPGVQQLLDALARRLLAAVVLLGLGVGRRVRRRLAQLPQPIEPLVVGLRVVAAVRHGARKCRRAPSAQVAVAQEGTGTGRGAAATSAWP